MFRKGFSSIIEFGKRIAGLSEAQIRLAINLEKKFEDKPELHSALIDGKISINKLVRVASIATAENEGELAKYAKVLSKASLDVFVKDMKGAVEKCDIALACEDVDCKSQNGFLEPQIDAESVPGQSELNFQLNPEVIEKLNALHNKGHDVNETILKMLEKREEEIVADKENQRIKVLVRESKGKDEGKIPNRNISIITKRILQEEYGTKCSLNDCNRKAVHLHHTIPFSIGKSNAPDLLKPLCREHHDILHTVNSNYVLYKTG